MCYSIELSLDYCRHGYRGYDYPRGRRTRFRFRRISSRFEEPPCGSKGSSRQNSTGPRRDFEYNFGGHVMFQIGPCPSRPVIVIKIHRKPIVDHRPAAARRGLKGRPWKTRSSVADPIGISFTTRSPVSRVTWIEVDSLTGKRSPIGRSCSADASSRRTTKGRRESLQRLQLGIERLAYIFVKLDLAITEWVRRCVNAPSKTRQV